MFGKQAYAIGSFASWVESHCPEGWWLTSVVEFQHVWISNGTQSEVIQLGLYDELVRVPIVVEEEGLPRKEKAWVYAWEQSMYRHIEEVKMKELGIDPDPNPFTKWDRSE